MEPQPPAAAAQEPPTTRKGYAQVNDIRHYYEDGGAGEDLLELLEHLEVSAKLVNPGRTLARGIGERARLRIMPKAGHIPFQERPEEFNAYLHGFIEGAAA